MVVTRTINPLHFEDLEPHRFEDLVRQLMYDYKEWKSIEATGRMGSDDGIDILAIENFLIDYNDEESDFITEDRTWIIQCKREQNLSPKKVKAIIDNDIEKQYERPYGYILVSSSNFSKKSRDIFKVRLNELGIKEFYIFGKAEIEDLLFQPKYDHLLFAYFGISLQKRKRSIKSNLTARLTTKRKLIKTIGDFNEVKFSKVFIKPSQSTNYPIVANEQDLLWRYFEVDCYQPVDCISIVTQKNLAYIDWDKGEWDIIDNYDFGFPRYPEVFGLGLEFYKKIDDLHQISFEKWNQINPVNKAFFVEIRPIPFDRILIVDEIGDVYNEAPHLIVDYINNSPFENKRYTYIESSERFSNKILNEPNLKNRVKIF